MNLTPEATDVIAHLRNQIAEKSEESATNWSGMQVLAKRIGELEKENAELKQRLLSYEGDTEPGEDKTDPTTLPLVKEEKRTVKKPKSTQR